LGAKHDNLSNTRYQITDDDGDINDDNLSLNRRGFKAAIIKGNAQLTVQNPFNADGNGKKVPGYIDMVGALNNPDANPPDHIFGFETAPARNSASEAVRRKDLLDTDDNSKDFIAARYASTGDGAFTDEMLEVRKPRNSSAGAWDPFEEPEEPENLTVAGAISENAGKLLIWQVGAATDGAITRSFVELYNNSESSINLSAYSIQYANGDGTLWSVINLTGTISAYSSYLVRGPEGTITGDSRLYIESADQTIDDFVLSNRNFKVALMANQDKLTVENPFDMTGGKAKDYVDLIGARNSGSDSIDAYETALAQVISKQAAARRKSLTDSDNNSDDFERIDYRVQSGSNGISDNDAAKFRPRSADYGEWNPVTGVKKDKPPTGVTITGPGVSSGKLGLMKDAVITLSSTITPIDADAAGVTYLWAVSGTNVLTYDETETSGSTFEITAEDTGTATVTLTVSGGKISESVTDSITVAVSTGTSMLMILQANTYGNDNGGGGGFARSLVELYNNTDDVISLTDGNYYLHIGSNSAWSNVIKLEGSIPAKSSFLIVDNTATATTNTNATPRAALSAADQEAEFVINNTNFKIAILKNQSSTLSAANPFTETSLADDYVDMLGTGSAACEKEAASASRPQGPRRKSLTDTNDNKADFAQIDYRGIKTGSNGMPDADLYKYWPRNSAAGAWNPVTGLPKVDPVVTP
jgi:hypothetical protein